MKVLKILEDAEVVLVDIEVHLGKKDTTRTYLMCKI